jgi:hypothetical protein
MSKPSNIFQEILWGEKAVVFSNFHLGTKFNQAIGWNIKEV